MVEIILSKIMGEKRITQKELSKAANIRPNTINDLYHNVALSAGIDNLDKICGALNCGIEDILRYIPNETRTTRNAQPSKVYKSKD